MGTSTYSGTAESGQQVVAPWVELIEGDCLEEMARLDAGSVDMILTDLPYGTTQNAWDAVIPFAPMWEQFWRLCPEGAVVLTAAQPFSSALVMSQPARFRYEWVWVKSKITGVLNAKRMPVRKHEQVLVFGADGPPSYYAQGLQPKGTVTKQGGNSSNYGERNKAEYVQEFTNWPRDVIEIASEGKTVHPTQKPVALFEYLIKTYTNPGDTVLDCCAGSGTTGIAARNTGRNAILIERDPAYYAVAEQRLWPAAEEVAL